MMRLWSPLLGLAALATALTPTSSANNQYALDDGVPNSGLTYQMNVDYGWFQSFDTVGTTDTIVNVQVMWAPNSIPVGTPVHLCVWEDANDDGDPSDAILLSHQLATVPIGGSTYTTYLVSPALVHGKFFVGAYLTTDGSFGAISLLDYDTTLTHRAWFLADAPGYFDPAQLSMSAYNHIEVLGAGIHGAFLLRAEGSGNAPTVYGAAKTNSLGCTPQVSFLGTPSVSAGGGFHLFATNVVNRAPGMLIYGTSGRATTPFGGGTLLLAAPIRRTPPTNSGGSLVGVDCSGNYHFDFGAWIATGADPTLTVGTTVDAQFYSRDSGFAAPNNIGLTNAIEFTLVP